MDKTPEERYEEIKREIIQISESYTRVRQNSKNEELTKYEQRHITLLHIRMVELVKELNKMSASFKIEIPLIYKTIVNNLKRILYDNSEQKYKRDIAFTKEMNDFLV